MNLYKIIKHWYMRNFRVITLTEALDLNLTHKFNIYGDPINWLDCRSLWEDKKGREYRCNVLYFDNQKSYNAWKKRITHST